MSPVNGITTAATTTTTPERFIKGWRQWHWSLCALICLKNNKCEWLSHAHHIIMNMTPFFASVVVIISPICPSVDGILLALAFYTMNNGWRNLSSPRYVLSFRFDCSVTFYMGCVGGMMYSVCIVIQNSTFFLFWCQERQMAHFSPFPCACLTLGGVPCDNPFIYPIFFLHS